jgi:NTE family protein
VSARRERIALVLAGGGARGAYEAGALAALAPALAARGESLDIIVGTSIGALNGAFFAARADEPLETTATAALEMWRELCWEDALRPLVSPAELGRLLGAGAMLAGLPGGGLAGLLDPSPLRRTLERLVSFKQIAHNVEDGTLTAAAVVATAYNTTRSVVFHHGGPELGLDPLRAIDYFATRSRPSTCSRRQRSRARSRQSRSANRQTRQAGMAMAACASTRRSLQRSRWGPTASSSSA